MKTPEQPHFIPLPEDCYINLSHADSSRVSWRSLAIVLSRVAALPNLTDSFISQAQFNTLAARYTPRPLRPLMLASGLPIILAHLAFTESDSETGQSTIAQPSGGLCEITLALSCIIPRPDSLSGKDSAKLEEILSATRATVLNQLSRRTLSGSTLPMRTTVKPKSTEMAAIDWADAMEVACANLKARTAA
ncbi:hypothetical protein ACMG4P_04760 [Pseudovibrio denitrificans]|uniref:hypothetical protein n=1 Tax=Pseudovibrio denitrificans TaxID=258256 RepID=UPI0039BFA515